MLSPQRWKSEQCPFAIDYPADLLDTLKKRALDALIAIPNGGLEIGGVLFGRVLPNGRAPLRIELVAERPIECSHAAGPSFQLTDEEVAGVESLLERKRLDPEIGALSILGFWVSRTRSDFRLSDQDLPIYQKLFPQSWQIVLILVPKFGAPTKGSFFFRFGRVFREPAAVFELAPPTDSPAAVDREPVATPEKILTTSPRVSLAQLYVAILISFLAGVAVGYWLLRH